jgi:hypothetical protein
VRFLYGPPDWISESLSARDRRTINFWLLILWIFPGALIWWLLKNELWFIGFMSIYAIWVSHLTAVAAETPVEEEQ